MKNLKKLSNIFKSLETDSGSTNLTEVWKQMRKSFPKKNKPLPTGVRNIKGKVITNPEEKKKVILEHFKFRMRKRPAKEEVKDILEFNEKLFEIRNKLAKNVKSSSFSMKELEHTLKLLKPGKSRDPDFLVCEIFKEGVIGEDLKLSILMMMNKMKEQSVIPECLKIANITMLHKKQCKLDLNNWRGIFVTSVLRTILMKLLHERTYETVAQSMTDSQIGAQKDKSVRNHIFVLNTIISDVLSSKKKPPIDLNIMDYKQMFDAEEVPICLNALYDSGVKNDLFSLICEANKTATFVVKTPSGNTERQVIYNKIMQEQEQEQRIIKRPLKVFFQRWCLYTITLSLPIIILFFGWNHLPQLSPSLVRQKVAILQLPPQLGKISGAPKHLLQV